MAVRCSECVFRAEKSSMNRCDYATLMKPHTRKAEPVDGCSYFIEGDRLENRAAAEAFVQMRGTKKPKKPKRQYRLGCDWAKAYDLYQQGMNDREIAEAIGSTPVAVSSWRQRRGYVSNRTRKQEKEARHDPA